VRFRPIDYAAGGVILAQAALALAIAQFGKTGPLPMHFGLNGEVNRWGDRNELAAIAGALTAFNALVYLALPALTRGRDERNGGLGLTYARAAVLAASSLVIALLSATGFGLVGEGGGGTTARMIMAFTALITFALGALIGKAGPNPFVGVRTFWTLRSRLAWDRSNRLLGRLWFWLGLVGLIAAPLAPQPGGIMTMIGLTLASAAAATVESWRVWRSDPERLAS
jgi:uncharacterized membrane protein